MNTFKIFSDSSCDLPKSLLDEYGISLIPFYITLDQSTFLKENEDITIEEFYNKLSDKTIYPKTSMPSVFDYINRFEPTLKEGYDILCFTLNQIFSGSYTSAINASEILLENYPDRKIVVIDSKQATGGQGLIVYQAARMMESGMSLEETADKINELKKTCIVIFTVDSLDYLHRGGRIGKLTSVAGNALRVKPMIRLHDSNTDLICNVRGSKKSLNYIVEFIKNYFKENCQSYKDYDFITGSLTREEGRVFLQEALEEEIGKPISLPKCHIGATIGTNTGPTAIGAGFIKKFDA